MIKGSAPSLTDFREYNHEQLLDWLAARVGGGLMRVGMGVRRIDKRHKPGAGIPLNEKMLHALDDPDLQLTDKIMQRVIDDLEREHPLPPHSLAFSLSEADLTLYVDSP